MMFRFARSWTMVRIRALIAAYVLLGGFTGWSAISCVISKLCKLCCSFNASIKRYTLGKIVPQVVETGTKLAQFWNHAADCWSTWKSTQQDVRRYKCSNSHRLPRSSKSKHHRLYSWNRLQFRILRRVDDFSVKLSLTYHALAVKLLAFKLMR